MVSYKTEGSRIVDDRYDYGVAFSLDCVAGCIGSWRLIAAGYPTVDESGAEKSRGRASPNQGGHVRCVRRALAWRRSDIPGIRGKREDGRSESGRRTRTAASVARSKIGIGVAACDVRRRDGERRVHARRSNVARTFIY